MRTCTAQWIYLSRINRSDTDLCQACLNLEDNLHNKETLKHFLFECLALRQEREELVTEIRRSHLNIHDIMLRTDCMSSLASFIRKRVASKMTKQKFLHSNFSPPMQGRLPSIFIPPSTSPGKQNKPYEWQEKPINQNNRRQLPSP
jgi:hypothetical protein